MSVVCAKLFSDDEDIKLHFLADRKKKCRWEQKNFENGLIQGPKTQKSLILQGKIYRYFVTNRHRKRPISQKNDPFPHLLDPFLGRSRKILHFFCEVVRGRFFRSHAHFR